MVSRPSGVVATLAVRQVYPERIMKILITGAGGMLGTDLAHRLSPKHELVGVGRKPAPHLQIAYHQLNLSETKPVSDLVRSEKPAILLHAAAMTEVDHCESDRAGALRENLEATRNIVDAAARVNALVIFF